MNRAAASRIGVGLIELAALAQLAGSIQFLFANFGEQFLERGITLREVGVTKAQIGAFNADLLNYISHLYVAIAGSNVALAIGVGCLAWFGIRRGFAWAWWTAVAVVVAAAAIGLPAHFAYGFNTLLHLGPTFVALAVFAIGAVLSYPA